ncbi:hypothetical protein NC652_012517 [Populus alba x Populus x berolinensis]|nr:hypothetical protein NC652_012517 [Populus alba x Populus x berolinensis]
MKVSKTPTDYGMSRFDDSIEEVYRRRVIPDARVRAKAWKIVLLVSGSYRRGGKDENQAVKAAAEFVAAESGEQSLQEWGFQSAVEHLLSLPLQFPQGHSLLGRPIAAISRKDCSSNLLTLLLFPCFCLLPQLFQPGSHQNHPAFSFQRIYIF